jgi:hypothetical protein
MNFRALVSLLGLGVSLFGAASSTPTVLAQVVEQATTSTPPELASVFSNPGEWMTAVVSAVLISVGQRTSNDAVGFMNWVLGSSNVINQTPPGLSYDNEAVTRLWGTLRTIANAGLAVVTVWGGVNLMVKPQMRAPYHGALELLPRLLLSAILINTSLAWGQFVIDLNNALCQAIGPASLPAWSTLLTASGGGALLNVIAVGVYLLMGLLLLAQMLMRLALVDALLVVAPLALLCWVLPQTYSWARLWFNTFFGTVFVQAIQVLVLQLGSQLIKSLPALLLTQGTDPVDAGRLWLVTLLLAVAVLQLARKIPRLMPGYPSGGGGNGIAGMGAARQITSLIRVATGGRGGK